MAIKTIFYLAFAFILFSCAEESSENEGDEATAGNDKEQISFSIKLSGAKNIVVGPNSISSSFSSSSILTNSLSTYQSGDLVPIDSTISDGSTPSKLYPVSSDYKLIEYVLNGEISQVYLVLTNDVAIPLSSLGLPSAQNGGTKNKKRMYQREDKIYYISEGDLLEYTASGDFLVSKNIIETGVQNFELQPNFIHYQSNVGQFIYKFFDGSKKRLNSDFNAEFKNFVYKSAPNCLQSDTNNDRGQMKEFEELCVDENGVESIRYARSGYIECRDDPSLPAWCQGAFEQFGILASISSCASVGIENGFMFCDTSSTLFYNLRDSFENQITQMANPEIPSGHQKNNQYFDFDSSNLYMISGSGSSLIFSKIDLVSKASINIDVSSYIKPNWITFCNGVLDMSIDDKFLKFDPATDTLTEVGSNEGVTQYECVE